MIFNIAVQWFQNNHLPQACNIEWFFIDSPAKMSRLCNDYTCAQFLQTPFVFGRKFYFILSPFCRILCCFTVTNARRFRSAEVRLLERKGWNILLGTKTDPIFFILELDQRSFWVRDVDIDALVVFVLGPLYVPDWFKVSLFGNVQLCGLYSIDKVSLLQWIARRIKAAYIATVSNKT